MKKYKKQAAEINLLTNIISHKAQKFAKETKPENFGDLAHVIEKLTEINTFLK
jgi:hypothetical protein